MPISCFAVNPITTEDRHAATVAALAAPQQQRLAAMQNSQRRAQFLSARHLAQQLLQLNACDTALAQFDNGRPYAPAWPHAAGLSWSHGAHYCAAALGQGRVGIDIETISPRKQWLSIAEQYFDPREVAYLTRRAPAQQLSAFYTLWVAKEALLKALGTGIVGGLQRFVLLDSAAGWRCESPDACAWSLQIWQVAPDALLALASDVPQNWQCHSEQQDWQLILNL